QMKPWSNCTRIAPSDSSPVDSFRDTHSSSMSVIIGKTKSILLSIIRNKPQIGKRHPTHRTHRMAKATDVACALWCSADCDVCFLNGAVTAPSILLHSCAVRHATQLML